MVGPEEVGLGGSSSPHSESGKEECVAGSARLPGEVVWVPCGCEDERGWEGTAGMVDGPEDMGLGGSLSSPHSESGEEECVAGSARLPGEVVWVPFGGEDEEGGWEDVGMVDPEVVGGSSWSSPHSESCEEDGSDVLSGEAVWVACGGEDEGCWEGADMVAPECV
jgi:hypothetical protein